MVGIQNGGVGVKIHAEITAFHSNYHLHTVAVLFICKVYVQKF